jgi:DNA polymerase III epsilon subunit-like protein
VVRPDVISTFVSVDIETTGLDHRTCDTIEVGAVIDDWLFPVNNPPTFHCYIDKPFFRGEPYALSMHAEIFRRIATKEPGYQYIKPDQFCPVFGHWLKENGAYVIDLDNPDREPRAVVAGKNYSTFDDRFLREFKHYDASIKFHHRVLDPGNLFWRPDEDTKPPDSQTCMERAGQTGKVAHTALEDALSVAKEIQVHAGRRVSVSSLVEIGTYRLEHRPGMFGTPDKYVIALLE